MSGGELGRRMGWPDSRANMNARRALGLLPSRNGAKKWRCRTAMPVDLAKRFCVALEIDPVEVGL